MILSFFRTGIFFFFLIACCAQAEIRHYVVEIPVMAPERQTEYVPTLLKMILNASKSPDEVIDFEFSDRHYMQERWITEVKREDKTNYVVWTATTKDREETLLPIRVPIFKGLLGLRILVIRKDEQEKFSNIKSVKDLAALKAGQGISWPDSDILTANGLPITLGAGFENLYKMLKVGRFDYFPRGSLEIIKETPFIQENDLIVEKDLLLQYPSPMYFFVNKKNTELASRIEKGWKIIIKNGEFERYFASHPRVTGVIDELKKHKRRVIHLINPNLPPETPLDRPGYWLDLTPYAK